MVFEFRTLTTENQMRDFSFRPNSLEDGLDILRAISLKGDKIIYAVLYDNQGGIEIPVEVFNQKEFLNPIRQLQHEWESILR